MQVFIGSFFMLENGSCLNNMFHPIEVNKSGYFIWRVIVCHTQSKLYTEVVEATLARVWNKG